MNYVTYEKSTGRVLAYGTCADIDFQGFETPTVGALEAKGGPGLYVNLNTLTLESMGQRPDENSVYDYQAHAWVPDSALADRRARDRRQGLLQSSDWTDTYSAPSRLGQVLYDQWQAYRQALRDITEQPGYPLEIAWPSPPSQ